MDNPDIVYIIRRQAKQKYNIIYVGHQYARTNTNNVNTTWALLQTTGGKDEPSIVLLRKTRLSQLAYRWVVLFTYNWLTLHVCLFSLAYELLCFTQNVFRPMLLYSNKVQNIRSMNFFLLCKISIKEDLSVFKLIDVIHSLLNNEDLWFYESL